MAFSDLQHFFALSHNRYDSRKKKVTEHKMCVLIFSTAFVGTFLILRITARDIIKNTGLFEMTVGDLTTCHTQYT